MPVAHAKIELELAARSARRELRQANESAESKFYEVPGCAAPGASHTMAIAQANLGQAILDSAEHYRQAIANAEQARLLVITATPVPIDSGGSSATAGPLAHWRRTARITPK